MSVTLNTQLEGLMFSLQIPLEPKPSDPTQREPPGFFIYMGTL